MKDKTCPVCKEETKWKGKVCGRDPIHECMTCGYREHTNKLRQNNPMKLIIKIERGQPKEREFVDTSCFHCGRNLTVHKRNIRAVNFCSSCK